MSGSGTARLGLRIKKKLTDLPGRARAGVLRPGLYKPPARDPEAQAAAPCALTLAAHAARSTAAPRRPPPPQSAAARPAADLTGGKAAPPPPVFTRKPIGFFETLDLFFQIWFGFFGLVI